MSAEAAAPTPAQDPAAADKPGRLARVLDVVRKLIDYGKELAAAVLQRTERIDFAARACNFGTNDIRLIIARITQDGVVVIKAQQYRSQDQNRTDALERLNALVNTVAVPPRVRRATNITSGDWIDVLTNAVPPVTLTLEHQAEFYRIVGP